MQSGSLSNPGHPGYPQNPPQPQSDPQWRQPVHQTLQRAWRCITVHCRGGTTEQALCSFTISFLFLLLLQCWPLARWDHHCTHWDVVRHESAAPASSSTPLAGVHCIGVPAGRLGCARAMHWSLCRRSGVLWRMPIAIALLPHHHRRNLGRCDVEVACHCHRAINGASGAECASPHRATPSRHQHSGAVNLAARSQLPTSPSSRRAASRPLPHRTAAQCTPTASLTDDLPLASHFLCLRVDLRGAGHTSRQGYPVWRQGAPPSSSNAWGVGDEKGWAPKPVDAERLHAQPLAGGPKLTTMK